MKASVLLALLALMAVLFVSGPGFARAVSVVEEADSEEVVIADEDEVADEEEADEEVEEEADEEEEETADEEDVEEVAELEIAVGDSSCLNGFNAAKLAATAATYQATYKKNGVVYSQPKRQFGLTVKYSDCSSFVNSVLIAAGYQCLFKGSENTAAMQPLMRARGGFHSTPKVGDIVMWSGHTGIVSAKVCPAGQGELLAMGVHGCAASGCLTPASMAKWGDGTFLGYWTPHA